MPNSVYVNHMSSSAREPNTSLQVTTDGTNYYPTYANVLSESDAFKIRVSGGQGQIKVYFREGQQVVNSNAISPITLSVREGNNGGSAASNLNDTIIFNANNQTWNIGMPYPRDVYPTTVVANFIKSETSKVRFVLHYTDGGEEEYQEHSGSSNSPYTITINATRRVPLQYVAIQNQDGGSGQVALSSVIVNGERETSTGDVNCSLKTDQTTTVANTYTEGTNGTRILTYNYHNQDETAYYISGGNVGAIEVTYALPTPDISSLVPIENDFFFYYNGGEGLGYSGYTNSNQLYRYFPVKANDSYAVAASEEFVEVNGTDLYTSDTYHSYAFKSTDAIGFKLKSGVTYRLRVHGARYGGSNSTGIIDDFNYLYHTTNPANPGSAISASAGYANHARMATYILTGTGGNDGNDDVYWILNTNGMNFGGFDLVPINEINTLDAVSPINTTSSWWLDAAGNYVSQTNYCGDITGPNVVRAGVKNNTVVVSGPTTPLNSESIDGHNLIPLTELNRVGFKLPEGARLKVHVNMGWTNQGLRMIHSTTGGAALSDVTMNYISGGNSSNSNDQMDVADDNFNYTFYYPSKTTYTTNAEDIWLTAIGAASINFAGFEVEIYVPAVDLRNLQTINGDYVWRGTDNTLTGNTEFGGGYLHNQGLDKAMSTSTYTVDGAQYHTYDFTAANNSIYLKLDNNLSGEMRVFYRDASATEEQALTVSAAAMTASWTPSYATVADNGTITFSFEGSDQEAVQYPTRGWDMGGTQNYSGVTVTLSETPDRAWQILLSYADGTVGSGYTTETSITTAIDPTRVLNAIFIQPQGINYGETLAYSVASATLTTAPVTSGDATTVINNGTADVTGTITNIEGVSVLSYYFSTSDPRSYTIHGGKIAGVEVLVDQYVRYDSIPVVDPNQTFSAGSLTGVDKPSFTWRPTTSLGKTINNGDTKLVLNGDRYHLDSSMNVHWVEGSDLVINETKVDNDGTLNDDDRSVLMDNEHAIGMKLLGGKRYRITAYWNNCVSNAIKMYRDCNNPTGGYNKTYYNADQEVMKTYYSSKPAVFEVDLSDKKDSYYEMLWIAGAYDSPIYFSGYKVETFSEALIKFDTNRDGIFIGKWRTGSDSEDKLLVYCTDNGTQENYVLPKAYYVPASGSKVEITTTSGEYTFTNIKQYDGPGTSNTTPGISAEGLLTGFEDTDNDKIYKVTYTHTDGETTVSDYYYVWYANYLKIGWWTTRDAKLIVGSNKSQDDPDHIIIGEFYISSGSVGTLMYEFVNPEAGYNYYYTDEDNNNTVKGSWTYTNDKKQTSSGSLLYDASKFEKKSDKKTDEEYSWTQMNDHKNHTGYALAVGFPSEEDIASYWNNGEVVKEIALEAERPGWPTWSAHVKFHFVRAPQVNCTVNSATNTGTTTITGYNGAYTASTATSPTIYYTTDGTSPTVDVTNPTSAGSAMQPTNATYIYSGTINSTKSTNFYATEMVYVDKPFYVNNPFTMHIEHKTFTEMLADQSRYFPAKSKFAEVALHDPLVEYCDASASRYLARSDQSGGVTTSSFKVTGEGGNLLSYPFSSTQTYSTGRMMNVLFGDKSKFVYRESENKTFKPVGVYWKQDENDDFSEHLDATLYKYKTIGDVIKDTSLTGTSLGDFSSYSQNGNPHTEVNGGLGGQGTEDGGLFLQPVTGDFLRFEPEYDGVITVWIRQNGAGQGNEDRGNITRRPVYVVDENGKVMKRTTVKPSTEHYFSLDGTYAEINSNKATMRQDCRIDWINGLRHWKSQYDSDTGTQPLPLRNMACFRLFNYWYGFPIYQRSNTLGHGGAAADSYRWTMDVADSWISRTAKVQSVVCPWNSLCYHSKALHYNVEKNENYTGTGGAQNVLLKDNNGVSRTIYEGDRFALYGYEMPSYGTVRYRFPVKAGKSYYMGGRGTKNGFMAYKFDRMEANYNPADYQFADNRAISELNYDCTTISSPASKDTKDETYIENSYYHDGDHGYKADHVQIYSMASESNTNPNTLWKVYDNAKLKLDDARGSQQGHTCNVSLWRGFEAKKWYTLVLPFSISESRMKEIFGDGVQVLYLDPYNNTLSHDKNSDYKSAANPAVSYNKLRLTYHKYQMLYANVPALVCPSKNCGQGYADGAMEIPRVTIDKSNLGANGYDFVETTINGKAYKINGIGYKIGDVGDWEYWITGSYDYVTAGTHPEMYFLHGEVVNSEYRTTFYHSATGITVNPTRCWIEARPKAGAGTNPVPPRLTEITFDSFDIDQPDYDPSGIIDIIMDDYKVELYDDGNVYDLLGRKVAVGSTDGLPKGVYIFNGQKVYVR